MIERYRKWGRTVRVERGTTIEIIESGEAIEEGEHFEAHPLSERRDIPPVAIGVDIANLVAPSVRMDRLLITSGIADHEFGATHWRETSVRIHVSLVHDRRRASLDLTQESIDDIRVVSHALAAAREHRETPARIVLAPNVTALLLPDLGVPLVQSARGRDGKGSLIEEQRITRPPWPNWFRPSYRVRPVRMPFHMRAEQTVDAIDPALPRIVAMLSTREALCVGGFLTTLPLRPPRAVGPPVVWYPHLAGAFGSEVLL